MNNAPLKIYGVFLLIHRILPVSKVDFSFVALF